MGVCYSFKTPMTKHPIIIDPEFRSLVPPVSADSVAQLAVATCPVNIAESAIIKTSKVPLLPQLKDAVRDRTSLDDDTLGACIEEYGGGALLTLKMCMPLVNEMKQRFKNLDRKKGVNGKYN